MKIDIEQTTYLLKNFLTKFNVDEFKIDKYKEYTYIIINETVPKRIEIYDDTICVVYGKNIFGNEKYDLIDWLADESELIPEILILINERFKEYCIDENFCKIKHDNNFIVSLIIKILNKFNINITVSKVNNKLICLTINNNKNQYIKIINNLVIIVGDKNIFCFPKRTVIHMKKINNEVFFEIVLKNIIKNFKFFTNILGEKT